jgi:HD-like signal output (HDOD) protein
MRIAADPNVDVDKVVALVQTDEFLAGRILQLINSAYFSTRQQVQSLRHAIVLLGLKSVGDLIFSSSMKMKVFKCERYETVMKSIWEHAVACAIGTEVVAQMRGHGEEPGFMAGLLHDIGKPLILNAVVATEERLGEEPIGKRAAITLIDMLHCQVGGLLGKKWRISDAIQDAVRHHHAYGSSSEPLTAYVYCGNLIAHHIGYSYRPETIEPMKDPAFVALKLADPGTFENITNTVKTHATRMLSVY